MRGIYEKKANNLEQFYKKQHENASQFTRHAFYNDNKTLALQIFLNLAEVIGEEKTKLEELEGEEVQQENKILFLLLIESTRKEFFQIIQ